MYTCGLRVVCNVFCKQASWLSAMQVLQTAVLLAGMLLVLLFTLEPSVHNFWAVWALDMLLRHSMTGRNMLLRHTCSHNMMHVCQLLWCSAGTRNQVHVCWIWWKAKVWWSPASGRCTGRRRVVLVRCTVSHKSHVVLLSILPVTRWGPWRVSAVHKSGCTWWYKLPTNEVSEMTVQTTFCLPRPSLSWQGAVAARNVFSYLWLLRGIVHVPAWSRIVVVNKRSCFDC